MSTASGGMNQLNGSGYLYEVSPAARVSVSMRKQNPGSGDHWQPGPLEARKSFTKDVSR